MALPHRAQVAEVQRQHSFRAAEGGTRRAIGPSSCRNTKLRNFLTASDMSPMHADKGCQPGGFDLPLASLLFFALLCDVCESRQRPCSALAVRTPQAQLALLGPKECSAESC